MKIKLSVTNFEKFQSACKETGVNILEYRQYGNETNVLVSFKHPAQLYQTGKIENYQIEQIVNNDEKPINTGSTIATTEATPVQESSKSKSIKNKKQ